MSASTCHPNDRTGAQLEALLAGICPLCDDAALMADYIDGRRLVEKMADKARGDREIALKLSAERCAQVLGFLSLAEIEWLQDPCGAPSHAVGFIKLMNVLIRNLRRARPQVPRRRKLRAPCRKLELVIDNTRTQP